MKAKNGDEGSRPNTLSNNILLDTLRSSESKEGAIKNEEWLENMILDHKNRNKAANPNVCTFNHVISA